MRRSSGFVSHPIMGAQIGWISWIGLCATFCAPVVKAGGWSALPLAVWPIGVGGFVTSVLAGLGACEGIVVLQVVAVGLAFGAQWMTKGGETVPSPTPALLGALAPSLLYSAWELIGLLRGKS